jgi:phosphoribosylglycinamide formyltransferase-1
VLVGSNDPDAGGLKKAADMGVDTFAVDHRPFKGDREAFQAELLTHLKAAQPDIVCLAGFMRVLTESFVREFDGRMLNIHPSLLPKYKGLHTHARAIEAGDTEAGCTVHLVTPALDDGPILGQARVPILAGDTPDALAARVLVQEHQLYPAVLRRFAAGETAPLMLG